MILSMAVKFIMNEAIILELAQNYMNNRKVDIVLPGKIGKNRAN